jgi:hypothetical protein
MVAGMPVIVNIGLIHICICSNIKDVTGLSGREGQLRYLKQQLTV